MEYLNRVAAVLGKTRTYVIKINLKKQNTHTFTDFKTYIGKIRSPMKCANFLKLLTVNCYTSRSSFLQICLQLFPVYILKVKRLMKCCQPFTKVTYFSFHD